MSMKKPLMVIQSNTQLTRDARDRLHQTMAPHAESIGAELVVLDSCASMAVHQDIGSMVAAIERLTAAVEGTNLIVS